MGFICSFERRAKKSRLLETRTGREKTGKLINAKWCLKGDDGWMKERERERKEKKFGGA